MMSKLFKGFFDSEKIGGLLLLLCTAVSLTIANSGRDEAYVHFWHTNIDLSFAGLALNYSIEQWINDGLMTVFFLLAGVEIKRERYAGELSSLSAAVLPVVAAVGGMIVPAAVYLLFTAGTAVQNGFGIPMATDIAFSLGVLALAGKQVPHSLKIFLTALAIIDDIGAILLIALFYNKGVDWIYLLLSAGILGVLFLLNKRRIRSLALYLLPGIALWYCTMKSGVHPAIAGVALAFAVPCSGGGETSPSGKLQKALHVPVAYFIVPLFALANICIVLNDGWVSQITQPYGLGIMAGLILGKPLGILLFCRLLITFSTVSLPENTGWKTMFGTAVLAGIGFTVSMFISNLAFGGSPATGYAKVSVLLASLLAALLGLAILINTKKREA